MADTESDVGISDALARARAHSPFLTTQLERLPAIAEALVRLPIAETLALAGNAGTGAPDLGSALRRERGALALALGIGDLAGLLPLEAVVSALSHFADE